MTENTPTVFEVGGAVRDGILGIPTKDVDFSVAGVESMEALADFVESLGHRVVHVNESMFTVVASVAKDHPLRERTKSADFVMCRRESSESDGRRPDHVEPGTVFDDLARRDFTVNAIAINVESGEVIDPHGGRDDLDARILRFVGDPETRCVQDRIRILRAVRFMLTKGLTPAPETRAFLASDRAADLLAQHSRDALQTEAEKILRADSVAAVLLLADEFPNLLSALFRDGLRLAATMKG